MLTMKILPVASLLAALVLFNSADALAASEPTPAPATQPTVSDAHALLADLIKDELVKAVNTPNRDYVYSNYRGGNCNSLMNWTKHCDGTQINWSRITSVMTNEGNADNTYQVKIIGSFLEIKSDGSEDDHQKEKSFFFRDKASMERVNKAMTLLMKSCAIGPKSKFD